jgi:hypothetical protein
MKDWLSSLKEGSKVIVHSGHWDRAGLIRTVKRLTATRIVVSLYRDEETQFRKQDGYRVGDGGYSRTFLGEATPDAIEKAQRKAMSEELRQTDFSELPTSVLQELYTLLKSTSAKGSGLE